MPTKPRSRCPRCKTLHDGTGTCPACRAKTDGRSSASIRGYGSRHRSRFRAVILARDPICVCPGCPRCLPSAALPEQRCAQPSTRADHYPFGRDELIERGIDPDHPAWGRGLCASCDSHQTSKRQPGGIARRHRKSDTPPG